MEILLVVLGVLIDVFLLLAITNGLKRYTKFSLVHIIAKKHRIFGMAASVLSVVYLIIAITVGKLVLTGVFALAAILLTGLFGILFIKLKKKRLFIVHRAFAVLSFILVIIHIIALTYF